MSADRDRSDPRDWGWAEIRRELEAVGFRPSTRRGQNFLTDANLARALVRDAGVGPGDRVLEVGPGCGFLTLPLAEAGVELLAVEIEPRLARVAARRVGERSNVRFLVTDVLASKHRLAPEVEQALSAPGSPWHVVANLPYSISGPLVATLLAREPPPASLSLVVQRELAERLAAKPGSAAWGGLSVRAQLRHRVTLGRRVPREMFRPRPKVESVAARLAGFEREGTGAAEVGALLGWIEPLFRWPRKTLRRGLGTVLGDAGAAVDALQAAAIDPARRPGELSVPELLVLARHLPPAPLGAPDGPGP